MSISVPTERVYYYECSAGRFRLVSFIPRAELERLAAAGKLNEKALEDFPDGIDIDCTDADFDEFEKVYDYRPEHGPDELRRAFLAIYSSTRDWKTFRGSGYLAAADVEAQIDPVGQMIRETTVGDEPQPVARGVTDPEDRPRIGRRRAAWRKAVQAALEDLAVEGVDPGKSLRQQSFSKIRMSEGEAAPELFAKVQRQRR